MRFPVIRSLVVAAALALVGSVVGLVNPGGLVHALPTSNIRTFTGTGITAETTVATGATGTKMHVFAAEIAAASTGTILTFRDGTAGPIVMDVYAPADVTVQVKATTRTLGAQGLVLTGNVLTCTPTTTPVNLTINTRSADE